jgi:carbon-monoxide dehydrogenase medium subunit
VIGGMTRHADVATSADVKAWISTGHLPAIGGRRCNRGDGGRSRTTRRPTIRRRRGAQCHRHHQHRKIAADAFFKGLFETGALEDGELVTRSTSESERPAT